MSDRIVPTVFALSLLALLVIAMVFWLPARSPTPAPELPPPSILEGQE